MYTGQKKLKTHTLPYLPTKLDNILLIFKIIDN